MQSQTGLRREMRDRVLVLVWMSAAIVVSVVLADTRVRSVVLFVMLLVVSLAAPKRFTMGVLALVLATVSGFSAATSGLTLMRAVVTGAGCLVGAVLLVSDARYLQSVPR